MAVKKKVVSGQVENKQPKAEPVFRKSQLLKCKKLQEERDILNVVLKDQEQYTTEEAERRIKEFKERTVK